MDLRAAAAGAPAGAGPGAARDDGPGAAGTVGRSRPPSLRGARAPRGGPGPKQVGGGDGDVGQDGVGRAGHLNDGLVALDFAHRLELLAPIADSFEPASDNAFECAVADFRQRDLSAHLNRLEALLRAA